jgi:CRISPR/Cas system CSM-associated protein Csm3 (group 7 of RAMP superfamily)
MGLMEIENLQIYQLKTEHVNSWPDSAKPPCEPLQGLHTTLQEDRGEELGKQKPPTNTTYFIKGTITLEVGHNANDYGLDMLSVGGNNNKDKDNHAKINYPESLQKKNFLQQHENKLLTPLGQDKSTYLTFNKGKEKAEDNDIDFSIATTQTSDGKPTPYIPGSSIRGSLRHTLSWLLRKQDKEIWEPAGENDYPSNDDAKKDIVLKIFGSTKQSSNLLIADAMPVNDDWQAVVLEMHAEDEFTQGAYSSSKFDHTCLTKGKFQATFLLEAESFLDLKEMEKELEKLQILGNNHMIPVGSGQWKGLGWIKLQLDYKKPDCTENNTQGDDE